MNVPDLPEGYHSIKEIDLKKDKKLAVLLNVAALIIMVLMIAVMNAFHPFFTAISVSVTKDTPVFQAIAPMLFVIPILAAYIFAHELTHGFFFHHYSGQKTKYGFHFLFASAGSPDYYYDKKSYFVIGLSPVILLGILLCVPLFLLDGLWFWTFFLVQIQNIGGAAGDLYLSFLMLRMPKDLLVNDDGMSMRFYTCEPSALDGNQ